MKKLHMIFQLNREMFAMNMDDIIEVAEIETMVKTGLEELHVLWWNKMSLPVVDPVRLITFSNYTPTSTTKVIVQENGHQKYGMMVENIVGVIDIDPNKIVEPVLTAPQYIAGAFEAVRILKKNAFLTKNISDHFHKIYALKLDHLSIAEKVHTEKMRGQDKIVEDIKLVSLNWLIKASKDQALDQKLFKEVATIHQLATHLK